MRLPRFQLKIRTLMITVATAGVLLSVGIGVANLRSRFLIYRSRAAHYGALEAYNTKLAIAYAEFAVAMEKIENDYLEKTKRSSGLDRFLLSLDTRLREQTRKQADDAKRDSAQCQAISKWYAMMKNKYQSASTRPWRTVPPDPQAPK